MTPSRRASIVRKLPRTLLAFEQLEDRVQPYAGLGYDELMPSTETTNRNLPVAADLAEAKVPLTSIPALNSNAGAAASLYLDFDGFFEAAWGSFSNITTPVYDSDNDPTTFNDSEIAAIKEIWQRVSEKFSPFNINVTTVLPTSFANGTALRAAIGGDGSWLGSRAGGVAYVDSYTNGIPNTVYVFPKSFSNGFAKDVAEAVAHEAGHAFGLGHQSAYNGTTKTAEYNPGTAELAPILGNSYNAKRGVWWKGPTTTSTTIQDDLAILSKQANGFGYRPQAEGQTAATATALTQNGNTVVGAGLIQKTSDTDYFSFTTGAGQVSLTANPFAVGGMLAAKVELRKADGTFVAAGTSNANLGATVTANLAAGSYRFVVMSQGNYYDLGQYSITGTVIGIQAPTSPDPLSLTAVSSTQVDLKWTDSIGETGYSIFTYVNNVRVQLDTVAANVVTYSARGLTPGTTYWYQIEATNASGKTTGTWQSIATPGGTTPTTPGSVRAVVVSSTQIDVTWQDSVNETGYDIYWWNNNAWEKRTANPLAANTTSYQATGLSPNTTYWFYVSATNAGARADSASVSATTQSGGPTSPEPLKADAVSQSAINLSWTNAVGETGYNIYQWDGSINDWRKITANPLAAETTSYQVTGLSANTTYYFYVSAFNASGKSDTPYVTIATLGARPTSPEPLVATATSSSTIDLKWTDSKGETGYEVFQWGNNAWQKITNTPLAADTMAYSVTGLTAETTYYFYVSAVNSSGRTDAAYQSAMTFAAGPAVPGNFNVKAVSSSRIDLSWSDVAGESGYRVYDWTGTGWNLTATLGANVTAYSATGLTAGRTYYYYVEAFNATGVGAADWKAATTFVAAPDPLRLTVVSNTQINLTWTDVAGETGYRVFAWNGSSWQQRGAPLAANVTSYQATGLNANTRYWFYVEAFNASSSAAGTSRSAMTAGSMPTSPAPLLATAVSGTVVNLTWTDSVGETSYNVFQWNGSSWGNPTTVAANVTSYQVTGLVPATTYYFLVGAVGSGGTTYADYATVKTQAGVPSQIANFDVTALSASQIKLSWSDVSGETEYLVYRWSGSQWRIWQSLAADTTTFTDSGLTAATTYYYYVEAKNSSGSSSVDYKSATTWVGAAPEVPSAFSASPISSTSVGLSWNLSAGATGYRVYQWSGSSWFSIANLGSAAASYTVSGLQGGTTYYFYVAAYNSLGTANTDWVTVATLAQKPILTAKASDTDGFTRIGLSWTNITGEQGYRVYRWNGAAWTQIASLAANATSYIDTGRTAGTTYYYYVEAYGAFGSSNSDSQSAATWVPIPNPLTLTALSSSSVSVSWGNVIGENGYRVYQWNGSIWFVRADNIAANTTSYVVTGLTPRSTYYFYVEAFGADSQAWTGWKAVTTF
ncbi:MAG: fibronectin type III domain-containing protein [Gemmataceae bacterium]|nr:fibronectin type III domain-containing protein [Gemmataceae bacterium]